MSVKVDINYKFVNLNGKPERERIMDEDEKGNPKRDGDGFPMLKLGPVLTLRKICTEVLVNPSVDIDPATKRPKEVPADQKLDAWNLAQKIHASDGIVELEVEEISMLKKAINKRYPSPATVAQAFAALDPTAAESKKPEKKS